MDSEIRDQIIRIFSITLMLIAVGACVVMVLAFVMHLQVLLVAFSGVTLMALAFFLFVRFWPRMEEQDSRIEEKVVQVKEESESKPMSSEDYHRQRALAQKLIRDKAAPFLAKAIRGILRQDEQQQRRKR